MADTVFKFSTTPVSSGTTVRIYNTSLNWSAYDPQTVLSVSLTINSLDGKAVFSGGLTTFTKSIAAVDLVGDFVIDILSTEMFSLSNTIIPDGIYKFTINISGTQTYLYETDEVFYYNCWAVKMNSAFNATDFICDIDCTEIKYAGMVNMLYQGLLADISIGNTGGIYEKIDIFNRLSINED